MARSVEDLKCRKSMCPTCVFRDEKDGGIELSSERREEIKAYLVSGTNQICHHDNNKSICRGGRNFQLQMWSRMKIIREPTDEALRDAMNQHGVKPGRHV